MSKLLSVTLPDRIHAALTTRGAELEQDAAGFVRTFFITAGTQPDGACLKLDLPPVPKGEVPLFEQAGVEVKSEVK